jgi:excinuclease ABC subunit C
MTDALAAKLKDLPNAPGVYFHKDATGEIIYVGKAAVLRNRVRQYFQKSRVRDPKTDALVAEIFDTDWMVVDSELEALFLEAEMIRRYMPRFNILLRDDKSMSYIRIDYNADFPTVSTTRRPLDDGAKYFGPYLSATGVRQALKVLRRIFPFATRRILGQKRATLHYHLGLDPGLEEGKTTLEAYRANLRRLISVIEGKKAKVEHDIDKDMRAAAKAEDFELAAHLRNQLFALQHLAKHVIFSDKEFMDISKDHALGELVELLNLQGFPRRIEGYDISHMQGTNVVASMVVFTNGASDKAQYRKFKTLREHNNDFYNMNETLRRRLSEKNVKAWGKPDLILIDGGKGQLDAAIKARNVAAEVTPSVSKIPFIGLAKREEQIVIQLEKSNVLLNEMALQKLGGFTTATDDFVLVNVPHNTNLVKLLQRVRDESHRFAVTYHSVLKVKQQTASVLDDIPGVGPTTRKKLIRAFGSLRGMRTASFAELEEIVGEAKATQIAAVFKENSA